MRRNLKIAFDQLVRAGGDTAHLHFLLGKAYLNLFINQHAVTELQKSIAFAPKLSFAHYNLGVACQRLGMLEKAGKEFDLEMTITPREPWSYENRGEVCLDLGQTDMAIKFYHEALAPQRSQSPPSKADGAYGLSITHKAT